MGIWIGTAILHGPGNACMFREDGTSSRKFYFPTFSKYCANTEQIGQQIRYGFEYGGSTRRIMVSPLALKCAFELLKAASQLKSSCLLGSDFQNKQELVRDLSGAAGYALYRIATTTSALGKKRLASLSQEFAGAVQGGFWITLETSVSNLSHESLMHLASLIVSIRVAILGRQKPMCVIGGQHIEISRDSAFGLFLNSFAEERIPLALRGTLVPTRCVETPDFEIISRLAFEKRGFSDVEARAMSSSMLELLNSAFEENAIRSEILNFGFLRRIAAESARFNQETGNVRKSLKYALEAHLFNCLENGKRDLYELNDVPFKEAGLVEGSLPREDRDNRLVERMEELYELASHKVTRKLAIATTKSQVSFSWALLRMLRSSCSRGAIIYGNPGCGKSTVVALAAHASTALSTISVFGRVEFSGIQQFKIYPHANALDEILSAKPGGCALLNAWMLWKQERDAELAALEEEKEEEGKGGKEEVQNTGMVSQERGGKKPVDGNLESKSTTSDDSDSETEEDAREKAALKLQQKYRLHRRKSTMSKWYRKTLIEKIRMRRFWVIIDGDFLELWSSLLSGTNGCIRDAFGNEYIIGDSCQFVFEVSDLSSVTPTMISRWALCRTDLRSEELHLLVVKMFANLGHKRSRFVGERAAKFLSMIFQYFEGLADPPIRLKARLRIFLSVVATFDSLYKCLPPRSASISEIDFERTTGLLLFLAISWSLYGEIYKESKHQVVNDCLKTVFKQIISQQGIDTVDFDVTNLRIHEKIHRNGSFEYILIDSTDNSSAFSLNREARFVLEGDYFLVSTQAIHNARWMARTLLRLVCYACYLPLP